VSKEVEEQFLINAINNANKKKIEYLEADKNKQAEKWENLELLYVSIYSLVQDGYKYRKLKGDKK
jgi:hypothetical protein